MSMRRSVKSFSILMLFVLGSNLFAEFVSFQFEGQNVHFANSSSLNIDGSYVSYENNFPQSKDANTEGDNGCLDPCHRGQCHFGHCTHYITSGYTALAPGIDNLMRIGFGFLAPKFPFLDGPKRPPRLS